MHKSLQENGLIEALKTEKDDGKHFDEKCREMLKFDEAYDFRWGPFFKAAILHFVYQLAIGPLIAIYGILNPITKDFSLLVNFQFFSFIAPGIRDTLVWAFLLVTYYTIFIVQKGACDYADLAMIIVLGLNRVSVIGVKYGCMGEKYWNQLNSSVIQKKEFGRKILLLTWLFDKPKFILQCALSNELRNLSAVSNDLLSQQIKFLTLDKATQDQIERTLEVYSSEKNDLQKEYNLVLNLDASKDNTFLGRDRLSWSFRTILLNIIQEYSP